MSHYNHQTQNAKNKSYLNSDPLLTSQFTFYDFGIILPSDLLFSVKLVFYCQQTFEGMRLPEETRRHPGVLIWTFSHCCCTEKLWLYCDANVLQQPQISHKVTNKLCIMFVPSIVQPGFLIIESVNSNITLKASCLPFTSSSCPARSEVGYYLCKLFTRNLNMHWNDDQLPFNTQHD